MGVNKQSIRCLAIILIAFISSSFHSAVHAAEATFSWDATTVAVDGTPLVSIAGYRIYWGTESREYTDSLDVQGKTAHTVTGLKEGKVYYFAVTAVDTLGNESEYSDELVWKHGDVDLDGLADDWEASYFGDPLAEVASALGDADHDGYTNEEEFQAGSDPTKVDSPIELNVKIMDGALHVSFTAREASGKGYENLQRYYVLERDVGGLQAGKWVAVPGFKRVPGKNHKVSYVNRLPHTKQRECYRARVWLEEKQAAF